MPTLCDQKTPGENFPDGREPDPEAAYHTDDLTVTAGPVHSAGKPESDGTLISTTTR